ncbi:MAG: hypothetical protein SFW09_17240 [Hyphomicrobiaceae bacterium]|nr:hypothetical protein [Hyphomicrobiaceae bacterium]
MAETYNELRDPLSVHRFALDLQEAVPTEQFVVGGINLWILIRHTLFQFSLAQASAVIQQIYGKPSRTGRIFQEGGERDIDLSNSNIVSIGETTLIATSRNNSELAKDGLLFVELPSDYTGTLGGVNVNIYADPVISLLKDEYACAKLCRFQQNLLRKDKWFEPVYFTLPGSRLPHYSADLVRVYDVIAAINRFIRDKGLSYKLDADTMIDRIAVVLSSYHAALGILSQFEPRIVFTQNFNAFEKLGFIAACKKLGVTSVDLMHGIQDRNNIYHDFPPAAADQIHPYPDVLWCWGEVTRRNLEQEAAKRPQMWRKAIVSGFPWKTLHRSWYKDAKIEKLKTMLPAGQQIALYLHDLTPQSLPYDGYMPTVILEAMRKSAGNVFWLIRLHPRSIHLLPDIAKSLDRSDVTNYEVSFSSEAMLDDLFEIADSIVTAYSVAGLEGASLGLKCITFDPVGAATFAPYIAGGHAVYCETAEAILSAMSAGPTNPVPLAYVDPGVDATRRALMETLRMASAGNGAPDHGNS